MLQELQAILPESRIRASWIDRISFSSDAGFYQLIPSAVVQPASETEIAGLFKLCKKHRMPLVFRTGGTSLSGQSITDGILVDLTQHWRRIQVETMGSEVRVQPGVTGSLVNTQLKKHSRKIGPDPSSISVAMMGGILSNNSSGMCCGVNLNSYHTLKHIRFMLPDGSSYSTEIQTDYDRFVASQAKLSNTLQQLRSRILSNEKLLSRIRSKYQTKNTVGYSLNALIDYEHPLDIFAHLLIGAEGTLAFIAEAVLHTVPDYPCKATALLYFPTIFDACQAIPSLTQAGAMMVELMDRASLRAVENLEGMPAIVKTLSEGAAALLVEFQEENFELLHARVQQFKQMAVSLRLLNEVVFTEDQKEQDFLWKVRKGLFPAVGAVRASGTTVILEDIAFPVPVLGHAIRDLQKLFEKYGYTNAIIFGHAKDGNIHFVVTQSLDSPQEVSRYDSFINDVVELVVERYDGTLKAEHGTGRNMAPFVETEWGGDAYQIMKEIKMVVDPDNILNPGVIINDDKQAHLKNLKQLPIIEHEVDKCIECGYCERVCPSKDITATPRRRIVIRRALKRLKQAGDNHGYKRLLQQYAYEVLDTCAVDGLCAQACPVDINTGDLVKRLRAENHSASANKVAVLMAKNFNLVVQSVRVVLSVGIFINKLFGKQAMIRVTFIMRKVFKQFPHWSMQVTPPPVFQKRKNITIRSTPSSTVVYFPSCITRMMGTYAGKKKNLVETFQSICDKAEVEVKIPLRVAQQCCGQVFSSKGFKNAHAHSATQLINELWMESNEGKIPVVMDVSSCTYTMLNSAPVLSDETRARLNALKIMDSVEFIYKVVLPKVKNYVYKRKQTIALHPVCALKKMELEEQFAAIAKCFAHEVITPVHAGCCGMAGDRGFLFPELPASAIYDEALELSNREVDGYYSSTKTCELALSQATNQAYESILYLVDEGMVE